MAQIHLTQEEAKKLYNKGRLKPVQEPPPEEQTNFTPKPLPPNTTKKAKRTFNSLWLCTNSDLYAGGA